MKNTVHQIIILVAIAVTIAINILADALPINGTHTAAISNSFQAYFVPAGYVFAIWGIIYIGLIAYAVFQLLPAQRENPRLQAAGWWIVLGAAANCAWIFLWHYELFGWTLLAMLILLGSLIVTYLKLGIRRTKVTAAEQWTVHVPFSIYLGWISVATIANVSDVLVFYHWDRFGHSAGAWMIAILGVVAVLAAVINFIRRDIAYALVILWALAGIAVNFPHQGTITTAIWAAFGLVALTLVGAILVS
jgi:hypothetical protein